MFADIYPSSKSCNSSTSGAIIGSNDCGLTPSSISMYCKMRYYGNKPAVMLWKDDNGNNLMSENKIDANKIIMSTIHWNATATTGTITSTCSIRFSDSGLQSSFFWRNSVEVLSKISQDFKTSCLMATIQLNY